MKTFKVTVDGQPYTVQVEEVGAAEVAATPAMPVQPTAPQAAPATAAAAKEVKAEPKATLASSGGETAVKAPMPGSVLNVLVKEGDAVKEGDVLLILEAMKMENELTASSAGTVAKVLVKQGDTVNSGDPLVMLA